MNHCDQSVVAAFARASSSVNHRLFRPCGVLLAESHVPAWFSSTNGARWFFESSAVVTGTRARGVQHMDDRTGVMRRDLHRRVRGAGRRPADQQRKLKTEPLHFARDMGHLVERRSDQAAESR